jgi:hypothetical protein
MLFFGDDLESEPVASHAVAHAEPQSRLTHTSEHMNRTSAQATVLAAMRAHSARMRAPQSPLARPDLCSREPATYLDAALHTRGGKPSRRVKNSMLMFSSRPHHAGLSQSAKHPLNDPAPVCRHSARCPSFSFMCRADFVGLKPPKGFKPDRRGQFAST